MAQGEKEILEPTDEILKSLPLAKRKFLPFLDRAAWLKEHPRSSLLLFLGGWLIAAIQFAYIQFYPEKRNATFGDLGSISENVAEVREGINANRLEISNITDDIYLAKRANENQLRTELAIIRSLAPEDRRVALSLANEGEYSKALDVFSKSSEIQSANEANEEELWKALHSLALDNAIQLAVPIGENWLEAFPNSIVAMVSLSKSYDVAQRMTDAHLLAERAYLEGLNGDDDEEYIISIIRYAYALCEVDQSQKALSLLSVAEKDPRTNGANSPRFIFLKAIVNEFADDPGAAIELYQAYITSKIERGELSETALAMANLANILYRQENQIPLATNVAMNAHFIASVNGDETTATRAMYTARHGFPDQKSFYWNLVRRVNARGESRGQPEISAMALNQLISAWSVSDAKKAQDYLEKLRALENNTDSERVSISLLYAETEFLFNTGEYEKSIQKIDGWIEKHERAQFGELLYLTTLKAKNYQKLDQNERACTAFNLLETKLSDLEKIHAERLRGVKSDYC